MLPDPALPNPANIFRVVISLLCKVTIKLHYTDVFDEGKGTKPLGAQQSQWDLAGIRSCSALQGSLWPCTEREKELRPGTRLQDFLQNYLAIAALCSKGYISPIKEAEFVCLFVL